MGSSCPNFSTPLKHIFANTVRATARVSTHGLLDDTCHPIHHATDHANFLCILLRVNCKHEGDETNVTPNPGGASQPGYYYLRIIRLSTKAFFDLRPALECRLSRSIKKKISQSQLLCVTCSENSLQSLPRHRQNFIMVRGHFGTLAVR